jgi:hypothetical protein
MSVESLKQDLDADYEGGFYDDASGPVGKGKAEPAEVTVRVGHGHCSCISALKSESKNDVILRAKRHYDFDAKIFEDEWDNRVFYKGM